MEVSDKSEYIKNICLKHRYSSTDVPVWSKIIGQRIHTRVTHWFKILKLGAKNLEGWGGGPSTPIYNQEDI